MTAWSRHGLIVPAGVPGAFGRGAVFEDVLERFNALVSRAAADDGAEFFTFPPIISRQILEQVHYLDSFPHLCGAVHSFFGNELQARELSERANRGENWGEMLQPDAGRAESRRLLSRLPELQRHAARRRAAT